MKLYKNAIFNILGGVVPALASLLTVPVIVSRLGEAQYGMYALVTSIVGYFAVFDINVTAGSVKFLAEHHAQKDHERANEVLSFGALIYVLIGVVGALGLVIFSSPLIEQFFKVPPALHDVGIQSLHGAAVGFLFAQVQMYLISVPQALQRYDVTGRLEGVFGSVTSFLTLGVVLLGGGLPEVMWARAALSVVNCLVLLRTIRSIYPEVQLRKPRRALMKKVASFSGYSYLSRLATITFVNADNLIIGAVVGVTAVSFFTVPFQLAQRAFNIITRASMVIFPAASALVAQGQLDELRSAYIVSTRYVTYLTGCVLILLTVGARELLHYWAGAAFDEAAALILIVLALSIFIDALTMIPSLVNDGLGHPQNTGVFAIVRAALGLGLGYLAVKHYGILGAAVAQLGVSVVLTAAFIHSIHRIHRLTLAVSFGRLWREAWTPSLSLPLLLWGGALAVYSRAPLPIPWFLASMTGLGLLCFAWGWGVVLLPQDRQKIMAWCAMKYAGSKAGTEDESP